MGDQQTEKPQPNVLRRLGWRAAAVAAAVVVVVLVIVLQPGRDAPSPAANSASSSSASPSGAPSEASSSSSSSSGAPASGSSSPGSSGSSGPAASSSSSTPSASPSADPAAPSPDYVEAGSGKLHTVPGTSPVMGESGDVVVFDVRIEGALDVDGEQFAEYVEEILADEHGWTADGQRRFKRVDDASAQMHILLVSPQHVEGYCPGYGTEGYTSCRYGDDVVINLARWSVGVPDYEGHLWQYRQYVINHEVGHYLGYFHVDCPGPGRKAPVMLQQTISLEGCERNPYPYPNGPNDDPNAPA